MDREREQRMQNEALRKAICDDDAALKKSRELLSDLEDRIQKPKRQQKDPGTTHVGKTLSKKP